MSDEEQKPVLSELEALTLIAGDRLVFIRILEKFANEIQTALNNLKNDAAEVERQIGVRNSALGQEAVESDNSDEETEE